MYHPLCALFAGGTKEYRKARNLWWKEQNKSAEDLGEDLLQLFSGGGGRYKNSKDMATALLESRQNDDEGISALSLLIACLSLLVSLMSLTKQDDDYLTLPIKGINIPLVLIIVVLIAISMIVLFIVYLIVHFISSRCLAQDDKFRGQLRILANS